ncbi:DUF962-domain-containing protein [Cryphonectria parasitica EP155]|uniref:DUF962-domain-containing protein n=1 Tax=Cryphonectria parasitica (strain ATCC 38755 / EP155) TaxID=660469 RepID=A0A9P4Y281_CRYP1|nr:DUF962-domain-containing protein [Cryphonectria parasitica EP155]KAF3764835.1 DUF962-domain-containing protein [Cryphonectria parasitica EP155]
MSLDLEKHLVFYGSYHNNAVNVGIHMVCVPIILMTSFLLAANSGVLIDLPQWLTLEYLPLNMCTIGAIIWGGFYVLMEPVAGGLLCAICLGMAAVDNYLYSVDSKTANIVAGAIFLVAWILQFVGHGKFEGRAPALLDNLMQALLLAPLFVWLELLFYFGYRKELQQRVEKQVDRNIAQFKAERTNKNGKAH